MNIRELSMRPGQNKRMRGRNNRKGPNPLTRTYESNGPDVKIRGTAQHIAEKYLQLARDAQSSGDTVVAENYLQHAEHYFRVIAAAQAAQQQAQMGYGRGADDFEELDEDDDFVALPDRFASPFERNSSNPGLSQAQPNVPALNMGAQPQPYLERPVFASDSQERQGDRPERSGKGDRRFMQQGDRHQPHGRQRFRDQQVRHDTNPSSQEQPRVDFEPINSGLPAFITSPTRTAPVAPIASVEGELDVSTVKETGGLIAGPPESETPTPGFVPAEPQGETENRFHLRPRRRRRPRTESENHDGEAASVTEANSSE